MYVALRLLDLTTNMEQPLDDTDFQPGFKDYHRILATCIEKPKINLDVAPPWATCSIIRSEGHNTKACDLDFNLGRLEDVCVKHGCMDSVPESMLG